MAAPSFLSVQRHGHSAASSRVSLKSNKSWQSDPSRIAPPSHRHAAPSAPWPWVDIGDEVDQEQLANEAPPIPPICEHNSCACWKGYPQSRFPNWTHRQVKKSKIREAIDKRHDCTVYCCDVNNHGFFTDADPLMAADGQEEDTWKVILDDNVSTVPDWGVVALGAQPNDFLKSFILYAILQTERIVFQRPRDLRVRALFIENMSGPVLQMLGAKFNIEPFFFSSSLNWIPSRFQEEIRKDVGDHITVTLPFIKSMPEDDFVIKKLPLYSSSASIASRKGTLLGSQKIDTQAPLVLYSNKRILTLDLISVHLVRNINGSTLISYHPTLNLPTTTAAYLHERVRFAGQSVYWQSMFQTSPDPTLVLVCFIWHALYAWDEALDSLYEHIIALENRVISTAHMPLTRELHVIRAHHLHYSSLLDDFIKNVNFINATPNPFMTKANFDESKLRENQNLLKRECKNLCDEVVRLKSELHMQERRLKNVMNLVFSSVNITDSKYMREMTEAAVRDSAAMKQIAYLTMIFLPASFVAGVFGMNVTEINPEGLATIPTYVAVALPLTIFTAWVIVAFQSRYIFQGNVPFWRRLTWPFVLFYQRFLKKSKIGKQEIDDELEMTEAEAYKIEVDVGSDKGDDNNSRTGRD